MSLFKAREWWSTKVGEEGEEFDLGCLCVGDIDNSADGTDKIVVSSYFGVIRIYRPRPTKNDDGSWSDFSVNDVVCEVALNEPVLQVEIGKFVSGSDAWHLAVLHPKKIAVYSLICNAGVVAHGTHYQLQQAYEHSLQRYAFNFCWGPFGGIKGKDFLCVQSMDGTITVFEQESFAFTRFLPGALLPGPIRYSARSDSFITVSSSRQVESYKYQVLAAASDTQTKDEAENLKSGKRVVYDWALSIGEQAISIEVVLTPQPVVYILGERSMFVLSDTGKLLLQKKFDFNPSSFIPYGSVSDGSVHCIVASHDHSLRVYKNVTLRWAAQLHYVPVQVKVASFTDLRGVIVTLTELGQLTCSYLGTDPALVSVRSAELRELDYREMDSEMRALQRTIRQQASGQDLTPSVKADEGLQIQAEVPLDFDRESNATKLEFEDDDPIPSITVKLSLKCRSPITNVRVYVEVPSPLTVSNGITSFSSLEPGHPGEIFVCFYMKLPLLPSCLEAQVVITYTNTLGCVRVLETHVKLPLKLVAKACFPVKHNKFRVTIDTNKAAISLNTVFPDLLGENASGSGNALGFKYYGLHPVVTVLASMTSQRYRIQSDNFAAIWLILSELVKRLTGHVTNAQQALTISFDGPLPLQEYFSVLDRHFESRVVYDRLQGLLGERASQFRAIERRLLTRFKDRTPSPLINLDTLLDGTYRQLLALADAVDQNQAEQHELSAELSAATRMLTYLVALWCHLSEPDHAHLAAAFTADMKDTTSLQGWEEVVDAAITHLLRTCLAKSSKDQTANPPPMTLLKDTSKLKKHIALLCDRLSKGGRLTLDSGCVKAKIQEVARNQPTASESSLKHLSEISETDETKSLKEADDIYDEIPEEIFR